MIWMWLRLWNKLEDENGQTVAKFAAGYNESVLSGTCLIQQVVLCEMMDNSGLFSLGQIQ